MIVTHLTTTPSKKTHTEYGGWMEQMKIELEGEDVYETNRCRSNSYRVNRPYTLKTIVT